MLVSFKSSVPKVLILLAAALIVFIFQLVFSTAQAQEIDWDNLEMADTKPVTYDDTPSEESENKEKDEEEKAKNCLYADQPLEQDSESISTYRAQLTGRGISTKVEQDLCITHRLCVNHNGKSEEEKPAVCKAGEDKEEEFDVDKYLEEIKKIAEQEPSGLTEEADCKLNNNCAGEEKKGEEDTSATDSPVSEYFDCISKGGTVESCNNDVKEGEPAAVIAKDVLECLKNGNNPLNCGQEFANQANQEISNCMNSSNPEKCLTDLYKNNVASVKQLTPEELQQKMKAAGLTIENCNAKCRDYVADMVYAEASSIKDPKAFQQVAEVIKNRALCKQANAACQFPDNPLKVITQGCQFSPNCNGKFNHVTDNLRGTKGWQEARATVEGVFNGTITPEFMDENGKGHLYFANIDYVLNTKRGRAESSAQTRARLRQDLADPGSITTGAGSPLQHTSSVGRIKSHAPDYSVLGDDLLSLRTTPEVTSMPPSDDTSTKRTADNLYRAAKTAFNVPADFSQNPVGAFGNMFGNLLGGGGNNNSSGGGSPLTSPFNLAGDKKTQTNTQTQTNNQLNQQKLNGLLNQQQTQLQNLIQQNPTDSARIQQLLRQQKSQLQQLESQISSDMSATTKKQLDKQYQVLDQAIQKSEASANDQQNRSTEEKISTTNKMLQEYFTQTQSLINNPDNKVVTDLNTLITSNLTTTALKANSTLTNEYRFIGSLRRTLSNAADTSAFAQIASYFGTDLTHELRLDLKCDGTVDSTKKFATPYYSVIPRVDGAEVLLSEYLEVPEEGAHCFAFAADVTNKLPESNEADNTSAWRSFRTTDSVQASTTYPALNFEVSVYTADYNTQTQDWTSNDVVISAGQQLAFRWDAPAYRECTPLLSSLTPNVLNNLSPVDRNTLGEIEIHEHTGYYEVRCKTDEVTRVESIHVKVEGELTYNNVSNNENQINNSQGDQGGYNGFNMDHNGVPIPPGGTDNTVYPDGYGGTDPEDGYIASQPTGPYDNSTSDDNQLTNNDAAAADAVTPSGTPGSGKITGKSRNGLSQRAINALNYVASKVDHDLVVTSAYRAPDHNQTVNGAKGSQHMQGNAIDLAVSQLTETQRVYLTKVILSHPDVKGYGYYPTDNKHSIHFDVRPRRIGKGYWSSNYSYTSFEANARRGLINPLIVGLVYQWSANGTLSL